MLSRVFCMTLRTFGLVIGWLGVIYSFLSVILFADEISQQKIDNSKILVSGWSLYLGLVLIILLASAMLLVGIMKERHLFLLPWLINNGVMLGIYIVAHLVLWIKVISSTRPFLEALPVILTSIFVFALEWYLYYGIYSLYKQIQATNDIKSADCTRLRADQDLGYTKVYAGSI